MLALTELPLLDRVSAWLLQISPYLIVMTIFTALYMFIPNTKVRLVPALVGGVSAGVLWAAIGKLFTALVMFTSRLTVVYAGFALVVAALLWTYFGWLILLIGAQLSFYAQNRHYLRLGLSELRLSAVEYEDLSLTVMYLIGQAHKVGQQRWSVNTLAAALGLPGVAIAQVAAALERAQLLTATDNDTLLPARDTGQIRLQEILEVARNVRSGHLDPQGLSVAPVTRLSARLAASLRESCGERTLGDLIDEPA
jgi:membrane protein